MLLDLELAVSLQSVIWTTDHISSIISHYLPRAATNILTKIRNFRDLRTCQKGPKSDQKRDLNYA